MTEKDVIMTDSTYFVSVEEKPTKKTKVELCIENLADNKEKQIELIKKFMHTDRKGALQLIEEHGEPVRFEIIENRAIFCCRNFKGKPTGYMIYPYSDELAEVLGMKKKPRK